MYIWSVHIKSWKLMRDLPLKRVKTIPAVAPSLCLCQLVHASSFASSRSLLLWLLFSITIYSFLTSHSNDWFINNHQIYLHGHDFNYQRQNTGKWGSYEVHKQQHGMSKRWNEMRLWRRERTNKQTSIILHCFCIFIAHNMQCISVSVNYWRAYIDGLNELCKGWDLNVFETCAFKGPWHFSFGYILI